MSDRIARLEEYIVELGTLRSEGVPGRRDDWALRYGLVESIQIIIDLACQVVARRNLASPASYRECIEALVAAPRPARRSPRIRQVVRRHRAGVGARSARHAPPPDAPPVQPRLDEKPQHPIVHLLAFFHVEAVPGSRDNDNLRAREGDLCGGRNGLRVLVGDRFPAVHPDECLRRVEHDDRGNRLMHLAGKCQ